MKCWIFPKWKCYISSEEIPLEVCKLCVQARLELVAIKRTITVKRKEHAK